ncbi:metal-dependent hydrolase, partial [Serratia marcescens]
MSELTYLQGYPPHLQRLVQQLIHHKRLGDVLLLRYPQVHDCTTDKSLYQFSVDLKNQYLSNAQPLSKVAYDSK